MHDSPSSPRRSIAPTPPKQLQPKKVGAPKAKGAVRAKSGCYTCRIRRKKCDERPNAEGRCETCIRLRLQCLGFGQKRPEWLKENNNVTMFREKIKDFLAAQGMIKGHSGSGTRTSDQEGMLVLVTDHGRSDTSSPHSPALSIDSSDDRRRNGHTISSLRHDPHYPSISLPAQHTHPGYSSQRMSFSSARESSPLNLPRLPSAYHHPLPDMADAREPLNSELILPFSPPPTSSNILPPPPTSLVSPMSQSWHHSNQNPYPSYSVPPPDIASASSVPVVPSQTPTPAPNTASHFTSTLPPSYHHQYVFEDEEYNDAEQSHSGYYIEHSLSHAIAPFMSSHQSGLVRHYLDHVLQRQYLLADTSIADFIVRTVQQNPAVRDAVCLLASLHQESLRQGNESNANDNAVVVHNELYADSSKTYKRICDSLRTSAAGGYTEGEAMAGLFVVSAFLFRGGRGAWQQFLAVAAEWVWNVLNSSVDPADAIHRCSDSQQFVIKTTFWFDILASTTRLEPPRFISIYRKLWAPRSAGAYIEAAAGTSCGSSCFACCGSGCCSGHGGGGVCDAESGGPCRCSGSQTQSTLCMMSVMGCGNVTALAIAETSALACWKEAHLRQGTLSIPELVDRGRAIEAECLSRVPVQQSSQHVHALPQQQQQQQQHAHAHHSHHPHSAPSDGVLYPAGGGEEAAATANANANAELAAKRRLTADIFRATARVYLHSVISGEHPACPEIHDAVRETIECLQRVPAGSAGIPGAGAGGSSVARSVLRSVVFGICLCGCLADDPADRDFLLRRLDAEERTEGVGNCASARAVMQQVWNSRAQAAAAAGSSSSSSTGGAVGAGGGGRERPLSWREATQQYGGESLLLV